MTRLKRKMLSLAVVCVATSMSTRHAAAQGQAAADGLGSYSIEDLAALPVTSVSGRAQPVSEAPSAIYVISSDDIARAGVRSIPGALRLAPNLEVARTDAASYAITARGFNHSSGTSNKLLVMMDGRPVYTPLFSGVLWDEQNTIVEDLDRIEVISGPGGTLWGSNAVNGVINIVSRDAYETTGLLVSGGASEATRALSMRYGVRVGETAAFRIYGLGLRRGVGDASEFQTGQLGFRADWGNSSDTFTLQGDVYRGDQAKMAGQVADTKISGGNVLGRWTRRFEGNSSLQVQTYLDRTRRQISSGIKADVDAASLDAQFNFSPSNRQAVVLGGGARSTRDNFTAGPGTAYLSPKERGLRTYNLYAQDTIALSPTVDFIVGLKGEHNSYTGSEFMPSARLAWRPAEAQLIWAAVSRAVRTPSRFDRDIINTGLIAGGPDFVSESVVAYELGYRAQPTARLWFSASTFYNAYKDLRTVEASGPKVFPLVIRNGMHGNTTGLEVWGAYELADWWRVKSGVSLLHKNLKLDPGSADVFGVDFAGNDPKAQGTLRSLMDLSPRTALDVAVRAVGALPSPRVPAYVAVDMRLGFQLTDHLELSAAGYNLFDDHVEFINPSLPARESRRSLFVSLRWRQ